MGGKKKITIVERTKKLTPSPSPGQPGYENLYPRWMESFADKSQLLCIDAPGIRTEDFWRSRRQNLSSAGSGIRSTNCASHPRFVEELSRN